MGDRRPVPAWVLWGYGVAVGLLAVVLIAALVNLHHVGQRNQQALIAICALEAGLSQQIVQEHLVLKQPGLRSLDKTAANLAIANAEATLMAIHPHLKDCP